MFDYFRDLVDYLRRILFRVDTGAGIAFLGLGYVFREQVPTSLVLGIPLLLLLEGSFGVFREERARLIEHEQQVRVSARLVRYFSDTPEVDPGLVSLTVGVVWEIWVRHDVTTERLALNLIYLYDRHWWQFWKRTRFPQNGLPREGYDDTLYRVNLRASDPQPLSDQADFVYIGEDTDESPHWLLELVLITAMPVAEYRVPVFLDYAELHRRGSHPPL
jgi:hypothetical protein